VSLNPNWAATLMLAKGLEVSVRLHYLYNARNSRPTNPPFALMMMPGAIVESAQAGQSVWSNFAASFEIIQRLHIGANGYYFRQLTVDTYRLVNGTEIDADTLGEGKAQVLGIGPGLMWQASQADILFANLYFDLLVQARAASTVANLRWIHTL
jgi:hypothetical protein